MPKFLEYNITSGHIISEITSDSPPLAADGFALLQVDDNLMAANELKQEYKRLKVYM